MMLQQIMQTNTPDLLIDILPVAGLGEMTFEILTFKQVNA